MRRHLLALTICLLAPCLAQGQLVFNTNSTGNAQADAGFQAAADFWSSVVSDDITVNLNLGFQALGGGILGQAGSTTQNVSYTQFRTAVQNNISSPESQIFFDSLPTGPSFSVYINGVNEGFSPFVDNNGGANNTTVRLTTANAKALGLRGANNTANDANITFNSNFSFDFDQSDGISAGQIDFVGVAIHEIGHALGFISGVDVLDTNFNAGFSADQFTFVSPIDFTRHSPDSLAAGADLDFTADSRAKFYSLDGGVTAGGGLVDGLDHFSRGVNQGGQGRQASHWQEGLGILDPTAAPAGQLNVFSDLDRQAFGLFGFELVAVPEPSSLVFLVGIAAVGVIRRKRS